MVIYGYREVIRSGAVVWKYNAGGGLISGEDTFILIIKEKKET
jgi:hypothetical protein